MTMGFGAALADFIKSTNLTQQEVADRTGVAQPVIGRLLKIAQPEMPTIRKIAQGLNVDVKITADGAVSIVPDNIPTEIEIEAFCEHTFAATAEFYKVHFTMYDKIPHRGICSGDLLYHPGETEPYDVTFQREDWTPGFVANDDLIKWAKAYAKGVLPR